MTNTPSTETPFSEGEEQELAAELLAVNSDQELDQFLGSLLRRAASNAGGALHPSVRRALGGLSKGAIHKVLPGIGRAFNATGGQSDESGAGPLLGLEGEGLSAEDRELNAGTQLVRLINAAVARALGVRSRAPMTIAQQAMIHAARRYAPGLVRSAPHAHHSHGCGCSGGGGSCSCKEKSSSGFWKKRGHLVILQGV